MVHCYQLALRALAARKNHAPKVLHVALHPPSLSEAFARAGDDMISDEDVSDLQGLASKVLEHCHRAGDNGPFDKDELINSILNAAGSLLKSSGVLVPGAGLVVDLCRWVGERVKLVKEGKEAAGKLDKEVQRAYKNLNGRIGILKDCERALAQFAAEINVDDFEDRVVDFHELLPDTMATLTRAGQVSNMAGTKGKGIKKTLRRFFGAKTVSIRSGTCVQERTHEL